jgi:hypothetical protein
MKRMEHIKEQERRKDEKEDRMGCWPGWMEE